MITLQYFKYIGTNLFHKTRDKLRCQWRHWSFIVSVPNFKLAYFFFIARPLLSFSSS